MTWLSLPYILVTICLDYSHFVSVFHIVFCRSNSDTARAIVGYSLCVCFIEGLRRRRVNPIPCTGRDGSLGEAQKRKRKEKLP